MSKIYSLVGAPIWGSCFWRLWIFEEVVSRWRKRVAGGVGLMGCKLVFLLGLPASWSADVLASSQPPAMSSGHDKPCPLKPWTFQLLLLLFVSVCILVCVQVHTHVCASMWSWKVDMGVSLSIVLCLTYWASVSRWKPELVTGLCSSLTCSGDLVSSSAHQPLKLLLVG